MFQCLLRHLGLDKDTKRVREETHANFNKAEEELTQLQKRFAATARTSDSGSAALTRIIRDSEISLGRRRRTAGI